MKKILLLWIIFLCSGFKLFAQEIILPVEGGKKVQIKKKEKTPEPKMERESWFKYYDYEAPQKKEKYNVAVLTPLFLDSVDLKKHLTNLPSFMIPGIDFYQGVEIAADTLRNEGLHFDIHIFDSKSKYLDVEHLISSDRLDSMDLIIGNAGNEDLKLLADYAKRKEINFVSAVSPSDAGQNFNPFFTLLQPQLQSHVEELNKVIHRKYLEDNVVFVYDPNSKSDLNALSYFKNDPLLSLPGRFKEFAIGNDGFDAKLLVSNLDTNYNTTLVLGVLNPKLAYATMKAMVPFAEKLKLKIFGMPTMEFINALSKTSEFPNIKIFYTSSFIKENVSPSTRFIIDGYKKRMGSMPTDLVFKGFESMYFFGHLMNKYGVPFNKHLSESHFSFITPYKILPSMDNALFKYYENKYLYVLTYENGVMTYE